jgi:hypothetical protein
MGFLFFFLFAVTLFVMYIAVRRELAPLGLIAALGTVSSIITMMLYLLSLVDVAIQGVLFGIVIGLVMSIATLSLAWYYRNQEVDQVG